MKELLKSRGGGILSRKAAFTLAEAFLPYCTGRRKAAFTLAEVLITLGIIGVVAALMIPGLVTNVNDRAYENQRKAAKSKITQAINMTYALGKFDSVSDVDSLVEVLKTQLKVLNICGKSELSACYVDEVKQEQTILLGSNFVPPVYAGLGSIVDNNSDTVKISSLKLSPAYDSKVTDDLRGIITADGTTMIVGYVPNCNSDAQNQGDIDQAGEESIIQGLSSIFGEPAYAGMRVVHSDSAPLFRDERACVLALVDVNGMKKPNTVGKDVFYYQAVNGADVINQGGQDLLPQAPQDEL